MEILKPFGAREEIDQELYSGLRELHEPTTSELETAIVENKEEQDSGEYDEDVANRRVFHHRILTREEEVEHVRAMNLVSQRYGELMQGIGCAALFTAQLSDDAVNSTAPLYRLKMQFDESRRVLKEVSRVVPEVYELVHANKALLGGSEQYERSLARRVEKNVKQHQELLIPWRASARALDECFYGNEHVLGIREYLAQFRAWEEARKGGKLCNGEYAQLYGIFGSEVGLVPEQFVEIAGETTKQQQAYHKERDFLLEHNMRLSGNFANKFMSRIPFTYLSFWDLVSAGMIGTMRGLELFDVQRGYKLSTYLTWWIRQSINRAVKNAGSGRRVPIHVQEQRTKVNMAITALQQERGEHYLPEPEKISDMVRDMYGIELSAVHIQHLFYRTHSPLSIDEPLGDDFEDTRGDFIADESQPDAGESAGRTDLYERMRTLVDTLDERERRVIELRFGLHDDRAYTLEEIGRQYGVTRERIRQIEVKALKKLRHPARLKKVNLYRENRREVLGL